MVQMPFSLVRWAYTCRSSKSGSAFPNLLKIILMSNENKCWDKWRVQTNNNKESNYFFIHSFNIGFVGLTFSLISKIFSLNMALNFGDRSDQILHSKEEALFIFFPLSKLVTLSHNLILRMVGKGDSVTCHGWPRSNWKMKKAVSVVALTFSFLAT